MTKRSPIPRAVRDQVLKEFRHRCAICGADHPQLHHIDEDPANNDPLNLIPLCPNCHLTGQHNPHERLDPQRLRFFREYKHPFILKAEFFPLFTRLNFLAEASEQPIEHLTQAAEDLLSLVRAHAMGEFYASQVERLVAYESTGWGFTLGDSASERRAKETVREDGLRYRVKLTQSRPEVHRLIVEMLAYQKW
jgi:hypothetical protein